MVKHPPSANSPQPGSIKGSGSANPQLERSAGSADTQSQTGQSLSPSNSNSTSGATAGYATSSLDNATGVTGEQGLRPRRQVPQVPPKLGPQDTQPRPSRGLLPSEGIHNLHDPSHKWVINLSSTPLIQAQRSLLAKGPYYPTAPRHPPNLEYITAIESVCNKQSQQEVEELRAKVNRVLRASHPQVQFYQGRRTGNKGIKRG